jgi:hypothetical protein
MKIDVALIFFVRTSDIGLIKIQPAVLELKPVVVLINRHRLRCMRPVGACLANDT